MNLVAGIDIGGTKTKIGLVDSTGHCLVQTFFRTKEYPDFDKFLDQIVATVQRLVKEQGDVNLLGLGIGAPNASNTRGTIEHPPNLVWKGIVP